MLEELATESILDLEKNIKAFLENEKLSENPMFSFVLNKIAKDYKTGGLAWPFNAKYAVKFKYFILPTGWGTYSEVVFFKTEEELNSFLEEIIEKANHKENKLSMKVFEWKFGPQEIVEKTVNPDRLGITYREQEICRLPDSNFL